VGEYIYNFDGGIAGGWLVENAPGTSEVTWTTNGSGTCWGQGNFTGGGGLAACADSDGYPGEYDTRLISPMLDLGSVTSARLMFKVNFQDFGGYPDRFEVAVSTDGGANYAPPILTFGGADDDHGAFRSPPGETVTLDLGGFRSSTVRIRFRYFSNGSGGDDLYAQIDDVAIDVTATCGGRNATAVDVGLANDFRGSGAPDVYVAGAGDDFANTGGGTDRVCGGDGNDRLNGGTRNDLLVGGGGNDGLKGGAGNDRLKGGPNVDICRGGAGTRDIISRSCERGGFD
jgi:Ca2+-binding RTX toxin-like protein